MVFIGGICLILVGCRLDQSTQGVFDNYLYRLSNSLDVERDNNQLPKNLTLYPKKSQLLYDIPAVKVNVLQFLQLSTCDLQRLVGQRNSSLGKLMSGYHSLLYEHEFLMLAKRCQESIKPDKPLYKELTKAIEHKQSYRSQLRWNATFASDEIRHLFSLSARPLTPKNLSSKPVELVGSLETLNAWLSNPTTNSIELQQAYKTFETRKYLGELRLTMAMAVSVLSQADEFMEQRLSQKPLCRNRQANQKFEVVNRVFLRFYIGEVQPILAQLYQQGQELFGLIDELQAPMRPRRNFIAFWGDVYQSEDSEWRNFNKAITTHTKSWQKLLAQCGHSPS